MADEQKPGGQTNQNAGNASAVDKGKEASATDLLSLWGSGAAPAKSTQPVEVEPKPAPQPPAPKPPPKPAPQPSPVAVFVPQTPAPKPVSKPLAPPPQPAPPAADAVSWNDIVAPKPTEKTPEPSLMREPKHEPSPPPKREPIRESVREPAREPKHEPPREYKEEPPPPKKPKKQEALEGEIVSGPPPKPKHPTEAPSMKPVESFEPAEQTELDEDGGFGEQMDEFLHELNLSRKHIFYGLGCLVVIIVLIFGGIYGYRYYKNNRGEPETPASSSPPVEVPKDETGISSTSDVGQVKIVTAEMIGSTGISATAKIGEELEGAEAIAKYIMLFRRLQNAYSVKIDELLSKATDRRSRLESHLALLRKLHADGTEALKKIQIEIQEIEVKYEPFRVKQDETDANFFEQLEALNAQTSEILLKEFIGASQEVIAFRARFKALQKIASFYESGLPRLDRRIKDIELNKEALITGVKVYDVGGSDVQLIVPLETAKEEQRLEKTPSAYPIFPSRPWDVKTDKDYILNTPGTHER